MLLEFFGLRKSLFIIALCDDWTKGSIAPVLYSVAKANACGPVQFANRVDRSTTISTVSPFHPRSFLFPVLYTNTKAKCCYRALPPNIYSLPLHKPTNPILDPQSTNHSSTVGRDRQPVLIRLGLQAGGAGAHFRLGQVGGLHGQRRCWCVLFGRDVECWGGVVSWWIR